MLTSFFSESQEKWKNFGGLRNWPGKGGYLGRVAHFQVEAG
jgi:hypothetical protein